MASSETKGTILYIEDNPDNRLLVKRVLLSEDYALLEARDGNGCSERFKERTSRSDPDGYQHARYGWLYSDCKDQVHARI